MTARQTYEQWEAGRRRTPGVAVIAAELLSPRALPAHRPAQLRARVAALADDQHTRAEIAEALGITRKAVEQHIYHLRRAGLPCPRLPPARRAKREDVLALASAGMTPAAMAAALGVSAAAIHAHTKALRQLGALPAPRPRRSAEEAAALRTELLARHQRGESMSALAAEFGVSKQRVSQILRGRRTP